MSDYDVVFFHPPRYFGDLLGMVFMQCFYIPVGVFSLASKVNEEGYQTKIVNLGLDPVRAEQRVKDTASRIYAIDLHWAVHAQGAVELADMCKRYHPNSLVVLGGFTATSFAKEILANYSSIDCIVMGEGEQPLIDLVRAHSACKHFEHLRGVSCRNEMIASENHMPVPARNLDEYHYTELSLLESWKEYVKTSPSGYQESARSSFWLGIGRGCPYDCRHCGGGRTAYNLLTGRRTPAFRSPMIVADDIRRLYEQGVTHIKLTHDLELMGRQYWSKLLAEVRSSGIDVSLYWESFRFPSNDFLHEVERSFYSPHVAISPESPFDEVRKQGGRDFTNHELLRAVDHCEKLGVAADVYFCPDVLPAETESFLLGFKNIAERLSKGIWTAVIPPVLYTLDPNCLMAIFPERYGITPLVRTFEDYKRISVSPRVIDAVVHETTYLSRAKVLEVACAAHRFLKTLHPPRMRVSLSPDDERWFPPQYPTEELSMESESS